MLDRARRADRAATWTVPSRGSGRWIRRETSSNSRRARGCTRTPTAPHQFVPVGQFKIGKIAADRQPHLTNAVIGDPLVPAQDWADRGRDGRLRRIPPGRRGSPGRRARDVRPPPAVRRDLAGDGVGRRRDRRRDRAEVRPGAPVPEREWLRVTLASIGDAIIATDTEGRVTFLNGVAETLTGWPRADAVGRPMGEVFRIVNEITRQPAEPPVAQAIRAGTIVGLANHTVLIARDGTETAIEDSASPIRAADGAILGVVMVFRDATDERRHAAELRESEERFRQMAESITQLAWMAEPDGHIFWYNQRWYDYTGTTFEQMAGWGWRSVHDPAILPEVERRFREALASGQSFDMVFPLRGADGVFRPFLTRATPLRDEAGEIVRWFGTNTDISDRQRIEDEIRAAKEEAETANQAKDHFLAILSHELRTPLNPISLATTSMLEMPPDLDEIRVDLEMIRQNVLLQSRLIDDLLDVMRIVRGKMPLHWEVADCHRLILQSQQICQSEVFGKELHLDDRPPGPRPLHQRRPGAPAAGLLEPDQERRQVHPRRRVDHDPDLEPGASKGQPAHHRGQRHRDRDRPGGLAAGLRPVPAGRNRDHPQVRRPRPGPGDLQGDRRGARRVDRRRERRRRAGDDVPRHPRSPARGDGRGGRRRRRRPPQAPERSPAGRLAPDPPGRGRTGHPPPDGPPPPEPWATP